MLCLIARLQVLFIEIKKNVDKTGARTDNVCLYYFLLEGVCHVCGDKLMNKIIADCMLSCQKLRFDAALFPLSLYFCDKIKFSKSIFNFYIYKRTFFTTPVYLVVMKTFQVRGLLSLHQGLLALTEIANSLNK